MAFKRGFIAVVLAAVAAAGVPSAASAGPAQAPTPLERCVAAAESRALEQWTCLGGTLTYLAPPEAGAPEGSTSAFGTEADEPQWVSEVIAPDRYTVERKSAAGTVTPMGNGDDWDTWCELGTSCNRPISVYIHETKANGTWGNTSGAMGTYDVILRTNLNGRQPRYTVGLNTDTGPNITFNTTINCVWDKLFDGTCGHFPVPTVYVGNYRSGLIYGSSITPSGNFFSTMTGTMQPDGAPQMSLGSFRTDSFKCPTSGNCTF